MRKENFELKQQVNVRLSSSVLELVDKVGDTYGLSRSEICRAGTISYCRDLLLVDALNVLAGKLRSIRHEDLQSESIDKIRDVLDFCEQTIGLISSRFFDYSQFSDK